MEDTLNSLNLNPAPGSMEERTAFAMLRARLPALSRRTSNDPRVPHTVVVIPSLSVDQRELAKLTGAHHYEERMLFLLMLLRRPRTRMVFVTSDALDPIVADYYLHLLAGVPSSHARQRLVLMHTGDVSARPLSQKILERPRLMGRIRRAVGDLDHAHMICFNSTHLERTLSVQLGVPLYANDPELNDLGSKSGCREVFREAGILMPDGMERLHDAQQIAEALVELKARHSDLRRAVVKLNHGFSGEGNAVFEYGPVGGDTVAAIKNALPQLRFEAAGETWDSFQEKYQQMGGVVEAWIEGQGKRSPSAQCRVNALGQADVVSTHDQVLGGAAGQVFLGCTFPAQDGYRKEVHHAGLVVAEAMARRGVMGRFGVDFVSVPGPDGWRHYAIEVNLRKGGTTHPFLTLKFLTDGTYDHESGLFYSQTGQAKYYYASDNLQSPRYRGLMPQDLIDISVYHGLHFHTPTERGVVFHLIGALSEFGKLGVVSIGDNPQQALFLYRKTMQVLDQETS